MTYQIKSFTCTLCGINFIIESDSKIDNQKYCIICLQKKIIRGERDEN